VADGGWGKAGFQICYEIIFSGQVDRQPPRLPVQPTNDGWFGLGAAAASGAGADARDREGMPVLRATTTGISAVIDADRAVPVPAIAPCRAARRFRAARPPATLFARMGNLLPLCWAGVLLCIALVASRRRWR
jgi:apolipoprotein N-acyltransferase